MKNILILYTEYMPYNQIVNNELVKSGYDIHVVRYTHSNITPYVPPSTEFIHFYDRLMFVNPEALYEFAFALKPCLIYTSGWIDPIYCKVAGKIRKMMKIPVIAGSDTQWKGGKQWVNVLFSMIRHKKWFSHIYIAGVWQYEYARKLGFTNNQILLHNLSADITLFQQVDISEKEKKYPKRFIYIGRYSSEKGLIPLLKAWNKISNHQGWKLTLVGNGPLKNVFESFSDIDILDFVDQKYLVELLQNSGCLILPSFFEPWALVLHEAAASGIPIIASDVCGANPYFVLDGYNGFRFSHKKRGDLQEKIERIICMDKADLLLFSYNSRKLASHITPDLVAKTLLSAMN